MVAPAVARSALVEAPPDVPVVVVVVVVVVEVVVEEESTVGHTVSSAAVDPT